VLPTPFLDQTFKLSTNWHVSVIVSTVKWGSGLPKVHSYDSGEIQTSVNG